MFKALPFESLFVTQAVYRSNIISWVKHAAYKESELYLYCIVAHKQEFYKFIILRKNLAFHNIPHLDNKWCKCIITTTGLYLL